MTHKERAAGIEGEACCDAMREEAKMVVGFSKRVRDLDHATWEPSGVSNTVLDRLRLFEQHMSQQRRRSYCACSDFVHYIKDTDNPITFEALLVRGLIVMKTCVGH